MQKKTPNFEKFSGGGPPGQWVGGYNPSHSLPQPCRQHRLVGILRIALVMVCYRSANCSKPNFKAKAATFGFDLETWLSKSFPTLSRGERGTVILPQPPEQRYWEPGPWRGISPLALIHVKRTLSWIFPDMSIRWETVFTVWICHTINEKKKGTSMVVHLDWELFHNKLLYIKHWDSPFLGPGPQLLPSLGPIAADQLLYQNCTPLSFKSFWPEYFFDFERVTLVLVLYMFCCGFLTYYPSVFWSWFSLKSPKSPIHTIFLVSSTLFWLVSIISLGLEVCFQLAHHAAVQLPFSLRGCQDRDCLALI